MKPVVVFFVFAVLIGGAAFGEIIVVDSLEWMTIDSQLVVKGRATEIAAVENHDSYRDVAIAVDATLKGENPGKSFAIRVQIFDNPDVWLDSGHTWLFFLIRGDKNRDGDPLVGRWMLRDRYQSAVDLDEPKRVYKADMTKPKDSEEILKIVGEYAKPDRPGPKIGSPNIFKPQDGYLRLDIPTHAAIFGEVFGGSACYITVPAEEKYRAVALRAATSDSPSERAEGAGMLRNYPGPETVEVLVGLLDDPHEAMTLRDLGELVHISYPARQAAYSSLIALGEKVEKPALEREPTDAEKKAFREAGWRRSMKAALPEDWQVVSVSVVESPGHGWQRTAGADGVAVECQNQKASLEDEPKPMEGHPRLTLYAVPRDWEGEDTRNGGKIQNNKLVRTRGTDMVEGPDQALYLGCNGQGHFFYVAVGFDPRASFTRYFGLTIEEDRAEEEGR